MNDYSRGYIGVQLPMDAKPEQVKFAVAAILTAFNMGEQGSTAAAEPSAGAASPKSAVTPVPHTTPAAVAKAELDKDGLPWDERIHAGTKTKTQQGVWTRRKGVDASTYNSVMAEQRQQYPAPDSTPPAAPGVSAPSSVLTVPAVSMPASPTPYQQCADGLARNTGEGKALPASCVEEQFKASGTSLAALANNQEAAAQFLEAFRGVLKQMNVAEQ